jgi:tetratricopeptide (TPR) repeat protein
MILLLACIHQAPLAVYQPANHAPPAGLEEVFGLQDPADVYQEAVDRRLDGDLDGAIHRLVWLRNHGDTSPAVLYQLGVAYEQGEDWATALSVYDLLIYEDIDQRWILDAGFRRAMCLEELGLWDQALEQYRDLPDEKTFDRHDRYTFDIGLGVAELLVGKQRTGRRLLETSLDATDGTDEITWMRGKGYWALAHAELQAAADEPLNVPNERKQVRNLERRAEHLVIAETYIVQAVYVGEPDWILRSLLDLGDAYVLLRDDLVEIPPPKELSAEEAQVYTALLHEKGDVLLRKAWESYDKGVDVAGRFGLQTQDVQTLIDRRDNLGL